jgi:phenylalanyl-tRNA synthetase alpha chain
MSGQKPSLSDLSQQLETATRSGLAQVGEAASLEAWEQLRVQWTGKKSSLSEVLKSLGQLDPADRPKLGAVANDCKRRLEEALDQKKIQLESLALEQELKSQRIDLSTPGPVAHPGHLHVVTQITRRMIKIFSRLGFEVALGPEVETEYLNFDAVNVPKDHPARDMQDTFFMGPGVVLRTHTSAIQMRAMRAQKWPVRILCPGAVFRCDNDATHSPMFHQVEGLWVDRDVKMSDLKGVLEYFAREMFGREAKIRLRPSYFPFVEPGAEVDVSWGKNPDGSERWLEILGAGMVHPRLFEMAGYAPGEATGFAFGMGVDRIAMLAHQIPDLRLLFQNDQRFLNQF